MTYWDVYNTYGEPDYEIELEPNDDGDAFWYAFFYYEEGFMVAGGATIPFSDIAGYRTVYHQYNAVDALRHCFTFMMGWHNSDNPHYCIYIRTYSLKEEIMIPCNGITGAIDAILGELENIVNNG
jgi:hypothetical protein